MSDAHTDIHTEQTPEHTPEDATPTGEAVPAVPPAPRAGRRLGVDVGTVRVGVALSDPDGILATPLTTLERDPKKGFDIKLAANLVHEHEVVEVVVGLPLAMSGRHTDSTRAAISWAQGLQKRLAAKGWSVPVRMLDERWSSTESHRILLEAGVSRREHRDKVDRQAAVTILDAALSMIHRSGGPAGTEVPPVETAASAAPQPTQGAPAGAPSEPEGGLS